LETTIDTENQWRDKKVIPRLEKLFKAGYPLYWFIKEAGSIRGIPDLVICANGSFLVWELKRSASEAGKTSGRIALQLYTLSRVHRSNGRGRIVHPDNLEEAMAELMTLLGPLPTPTSSLLPLQHDAHSGVDAGCE
jgi:hypothetical protein